MIPQIIILSLIAVGLILYALADGKPKSGNWSFKAYLVSSIIKLGILYAGGFFDGFFK